MISIIGLFYGVKSDGHYLLFLLYDIYLKMQGAHRGRGFLHCLYEHYNVKYGGLLQANVSWPRIVPSRLFGFHSPTLSPSAQSDQSEPPVHCKSTPVHCSRSNCEQDKNHAIFGQIYQLAPGFRVIMPCVRSIFVSWE